MIYKDDIDYDSGILGVYFCVKVRVLINTLLSARGYKEIQWII